ncbi:MAG: dihydroorotate dehydrogenase electron transfer subunit [Candidatus Ranarchaeia archaeon]
MSQGIQNLSDQYPKVLRIKKIKIENKRTVSIFLTLKDNMGEPKPGQYYMIWVPGSDEIPISVADFDEKNKEIKFTIVNVGKTTEEIQKLKNNDLLGIRGPYGNGFNYEQIQNNSALLIGGGFGTAPLVFLAKQLRRKNVKIISLTGSSTKELLFGEEELQKLSEECYISTDDGSKGHKGYITELLPDLLEKNKIGIVFTCGPELMMKTTYSICVQKKIPLQASLERYMKCALGICGSCGLGEYLVCIDGPVFSNQDLEKVSKEWGVFTRDAAGKKIEF